MDGVVVYPVNAHSVHLILWNNGCHTGITVVDYYAAVDPESNSCNCNKMRKGKLNCLPFSFVCKTVADQ
jgi:hypothetical protein